jgi:hypothetical protein
MREETLFERIAIAIMFVLFLVFSMWTPDFFLTEEECAQQSKYSILYGLCSEPKAK